MRAVAVLLFFAGAFGVAALWQSRRVARLEAERALAERVQAGELAKTPDGPIESGWAAVVIGGPSGVAPSSAAPQQDPVSGAGEQQPEDGGSSTEPAAPEQTPAMLGDFELNVEVGQTLSEIARAHYGSAARDLVRALASYNGLSDENALRAGQLLRLPPIDQLQR